MAKTARITGFLKGSFLFIAGFVASQVVDIEVLDLRSALPTNRGMTSQKFAGVSNGNEVMEDDSSSSKFRRPVAASSTVETPTATQQHLFDRMVEQTYRRAILGDKTSASQRRRASFDITFWEEESNMTTSGGLQTKDRLLLADIYGSARSVFEYGLGESTYLANYVGVPRYAGIDSDPVWVTMVRDRVSPNFRFSLADIGETREWGYPTTTTLAKNMWNYQLQPLVAEQQPFDVYMVDGRWRMGCMLASFLHASARGAKWTDTTVLLHDCKGNAERPVYNKADHLLDLVQHSGARLCVYKRKESTTDLQLWNLWNDLAGKVQRL